MHPGLLGGIVLVLLIAGVAVTFATGGPDVDAAAAASERDPLMMGQREVLAAMLGLVLLAFVAFGWDDSIER